MHQLLFIFIVTIIFNSFFSSLARFKYLFNFSLSFILTLRLSGMAKSTRLQVLFFNSLLKSGLLVEFRRSVWISKSRRILCVSFSRIDSGLSRYHLVDCSNLKLLHNYQCILFPTQSGIILNLFCASFLRLRIIWITVLSLFPQNPHLLFCCV